MSKLGWVAGTFGAIAVGVPLGIGLYHRAHMASGESPITAADADLLILQQHLQRIAMHGKALAKDDMDRAYAIAIKFGMPKTAATIRSIAVDGKPGGPTYVALPIDEKWPGTQLSSRAFIAQAMNALKSQATA